MSEILANPSIVVVGSGEAFSSDLGNTSYLLRGPGLPTMLFDCGYQIPQRLWQKELHHDIEAIVLTHLHADHAFGLVPLLTRFWDEKRKRPLKIIGHRGTKSYLKRLFELGYPRVLSMLTYEIEYVKLSMVHPIVWPQLSIRVAQSSHTVLNYSLRIDFTSTVYKSFGVSGDGQITPRTKSLFHDVELLLQEVYSLEPESNFHCDLKTLHAWLSETKIKQLGIAHHANPQLAEIHGRLEILKANDSRWMALKPSMEISLC